MLNLHFQFLSENTTTAVWKGDPCSRNFLSDIDLLTPELNLIWTPPQFPLAARDRKLVVTAVGQSKREISINSFGVAYYLF